MTMLAKGTETGVATLAEYEARIHLYREQIGVGYIGIGRTLNEAKAAKAVPHGEWESWVERTTGLTIRQAQRCMRAATEIRDGSALARLEMSKALLLLGSGLESEDQERLAEKAAEESQSVRSLREEIDRLKGAMEAERADSGQVIRELKKKIVEESGAGAEIRIQLEKAKRERDGLIGQLQDTQKAYQARMDEENEKAYRQGMRDQEEEARKAVRKEFQGKIDMINSERKTAEARIRELEEELARAGKEGSARWDEGYQAGTREAEEIRKELDGARNEANRQRQYAEDLKRSQGDLLMAAEEAEKRAADAEAELEALRSGAQEREPSWMTIRKAADALLAECEMLPIKDPAGMRKGRERIGICLDRLETWIAVVREAMADGAIEAEGAIL